MYLHEQRITRMLEELGKYIYKDRLELDGCRFCETRLTDRDEALSLADGWRPFGRYERWGGVDKTGWFSFDITIPESYDGEYTEVHIRSGRQGEWYPGGPQYLVFVDGKPEHHMDLWHEKFLLTEKARGGQTYRIDVQAFSGVKEILTGFEIDLYTVDKPVEALYFDIKTVFDSILLLDEGDKDRIDAVNALIETINLIDLRKPRSELFYASLEKARRYADEHLYGPDKALKGITAYCPGHTHLDIAWLWTIEDSKKKAVRTFVHNLELMDRYPEYVFICSQPQVYKFVKETYPEIYERVKQRVREGRWQPEGAMWVEPDCNLPSGESFVRQLLLGKRFFKREFGIDSQILWLPDVFGFSGALPQILKKSGVDYFMTTKLSWNEYNVFPYDLFRWQGIDGSEILSYFTCHHAAYLGSKAVNEVWKDFKQKSISSDVLVPFGWGDAGGGPTDDMLEAGLRLQKGVPGSPAVKLAGIKEFTRALDRAAKQAGEKLPVWVGELYFELHRGTYTSMAKSKRFNRKSELLYQDCELINALAGKLAGTPYPNRELNEAWETIALNQFHDILPGSSVEDVYKTSFMEYSRLLDEGRGMLDKAALTIVDNIDTPAESVVVFNQLGRKRSDIVEIKLPEGYDDIAVYDGEREVPVQDIGEGKALIFAENVPSKGYKTFTLQRRCNTPASQKCSGEKGRSFSDARPGSCLEVSPGGISNRFFDILLDEDGTFKSIYDKLNGREVLKAGERGNVLQVFEDLPQRWNDAWDINIYYNEKKWEVTDLESIEVVERGPIRAVLRIKRRFLDSVLVQDICVYEDIPRIDFKTVVDWKEKHLLLKALFPVDVHAIYGTYDIQFGSIQRPNHWNTSWDYARFEVCAHKWADLSEGGYGVSLLNDCKYGYDIKGGNMRITLIKSADYPNINADRDVHEFIYSLYPHRGGWHEGGTVDMAYRLNCPMYAYTTGRHEGRLPGEFSLLSVDKGNVIIETVKKAEDSDCIIIRAYEAHNMKTTARFTCSLGGFNAYECDLMENELTELPVSHGQFECLVKPFEIKTFKIALK